MLGPGEGAAPHLCRIRLERVADLAREVGVPLHEPRQVALGQAEQVVVDEHLAVAPGAGADPDRRDLEPPGDLVGHGCRHGLQHQRDAARRLERQRAVDELTGGRGGLALRLETAEEGRGLRGQPDVADHPDAGLHDRAGSRDHRPCAFELHDVRPGFLDEADRVPDRVLVGHLVGAERHVADDDRPVHRTHDGACEKEHLVHRHGDRRTLVTEDDHRRACRPRGSCRCPRPRRTARRACRTR